MILNDVAGHDCPHAKSIRTTAFSRSSPQNTTTPTSMCITCAGTARLGGVLDRRPRARLFPPKIDTRFSGSGGRAKYGAGRCLGCGPPAKPQRDRQTHKQLHSYVGRTESQWVKRALLRGGSRFCRSFGASQVGSIYLSMALNGCVLF